ncbi:hypothetical protein EON65_58235 [archaeon]|nr:MAG: hypothetical protein EON65_58235 [archaeon]
MGEQRAYEPMPRLRSKKLPFATLNLLTTRLGTPSSPLSTERRAGANSQFLSAPQSKKKIKGRPSTPTFRYDYRRL